MLKSCLVLGDIKDIKFKVDNFSSENMKIIEDAWLEISEAIQLGVQLAALFGFDGKTLTSTNAIIPIAYFLKKNNLGENILHADSQSENRKRIKQWLLRALLKRAFGGQPDSLYPIYRRLINDAGSSFPLDEIIKEFSGRSRTLDFYEPDIDALLEVEYGSAYAFMLLSLFCPINHDYEFHQDHIFPKKYFYKKLLKEKGLATEEEQQPYLERFNMLPNLQLLNKIPNQEKSDKMVDTWLAKVYPDSANLQNYMDLHLFPADQSLDFSNFVKFYEARKKLIRSKLVGLIDVQKPSQ